jgi:hypothetical protein
MFLELGHHKCDLREGMKEGPIEGSVVKEVEMIGGDAIVARIGKIVNCKIP